MTSISRSSISVPPPLSSRRRAIFPSYANSKTTRSQSPQRPQIHRTPHRRGQSPLLYERLKTGIDANSLVIQHESAGRLEALADEYYDRFHPTTPSSACSSKPSSIPSGSSAACRSPTLAAGLPNVTNAIYDVNLAVAFRKTCDEFSRLQRRIDMTHRHYRHALQELERLQAEEAEGIAEEIAEEAEPSAPAPDPEPAPAPRNSARHNH